MVKEGSSAFNALCGKGLLGSSAGGVRRAGSRGAMNTKHHHNLLMYVNDVIGLERDIIHAMEGQLDDDRMTANTQAAAVLRASVAASQARLQILKHISETEGGSLGAAVKEAAMSVTGVLAGIYDRLRVHPVSRMLRDDVCALNVASVSYTMLYTLARGAGSAGVSEIALQGMREVPPLVMDLTHLLPTVVLGELSDEAPLADPTAEGAVLDAIHESWSQHSSHVAGVR